MLSERAINTTVLPVWLCKEEAASPAGEEAASVLGGAGSCACRGAGRWVAALCKSPPLPEVGTDCFHPAWVAEPSPVAPCQTGCISVFLESSTWGSHGGLSGSQGRRRRVRCIQRLVLGTDSEVLV